VRDPSHNSVDFSQRTAAGMDDDGPEGLIRALRRALPYHYVWTDPVATKRLEDGIRGSLAGRDTSPEEDARLQQARADDERFWKDPAEWQGHMPSRL